jgi:hypothetical protein
VRCSAQVDNQHPRPAEYLTPDGLCTSEATIVYKGWSLCDRHLSEHLEWQRRESDQRVARAHERTKALTHELESMT